jgi:hypothetical protein
VPLYEIVLRFPDRDEVRLADRNGYVAGAEVVIAGRTYRVLGTEPPQSAEATERLVLEPIGDRTT